MTLHPPKRSTKSPMTSQCVNIHECRAEIRDAGSGNIQAFLKFIKDGAGNGDSLNVGEEVKNGTAEEKNP